VVEVEVVVMVVMVEVELMAMAVGGCTRFFNRMCRIHLLNAPSPFQHLTLFTVLAHFLFL
jgi:hypothetical protein